MLFYISIGALLFTLAIYCKQKYSRFSKCGVPHLTIIPPLGTVRKVLFRLRHFLDAINDAYKAFPEDKFVGHYLFLKPVLYVKDLELIKKVAVKDFDHFVDHQHVVNKEVDPIFGRNLISLKGQEWKDMRSTLSPAFTSSKVRNMLPLILEVAEQMISSLKKQLLESEHTSVEIDAKDLATRYSNDVIASCAFGLKVDSLSDRDNQFYRMGFKASQLDFVTLLKIVGYTAMPALMKLFKTPVFPEEPRLFFNHLVIRTMREREAHNILRPDIIHLLMEAKKGQLTHDEKSSNDDDVGFATVEESTVGKKKVNRVWSDSDLVAQAAFFFVAGFETVSTALTFLMYELAVNPEVQERLAQEIKDHIKANGGKFDYSSIQTLSYLDMVISETLRLWPPAIGADRMCVKEYNLGRVNEKATADYIVHVNESVTIPIFAIHRDPKYYPNPLKFDPERFSDENKPKIQPFTYIPFGVGPRNCVASRFALFEMKVMICHALQHIKVEPSERTQSPIKLDPGSINLNMTGGHWLQMRARD